MPDPDALAASLPPEALRVISVGVERASHISPALLLRLQYERDDVVGDKRIDPMQTFAVSVPAAYRIARELDNAVRNYIGISDDEGIP